jgi:hypothetical protein
MQDKTEHIPIIDRSSSGSGKGTAQTARRGGAPKLTASLQVAATRQDRVG